MSTCTDLATSKMTTIWLVCTTSTGAALTDVALSNCLKTRTATRYRATSPCRSFESSNWRTSSSSVWRLAIFLVTKDYFRCWFLLPIAELDSLNLAENCANLCQANLLRTSFRLPAGCRCSSPSMLAIDASSESDLYSSLVICSSTLCCSTCFCFAIFTKGSTLCSWKSFK